MIDKINNFCKINIVFLIIFLFANFNIAAQSNVGNKYGLNVINNIKVLKRETELDADKKMIDVKKAIPSLVIDLKYATTHNFMHRRLYPALRTTYLRLPVVNALKKVEAELNKKNVALKIFDAYRPYSVTEEMWDAVKDSRYAADPSHGSGHNRGIAVDVTLENLQTKKELAMGTGFDNFSDSAHTNFIKLPDSVLYNRRLLITVMKKYGFNSLDTEWWHFSFPDADKYELLNVSFNDLKKLNKRLKY